MDFDADSPIENFADDRFLFATFARGLAQQLLEYDRPTSFVIGINGAWGTGKTSLLRLLEKSLRSDTTHVVPIIIRYSPWIVRNRDALLRELLPELSEQVRIRTPTSSNPAMKTAWLALSRYARAVRGVELGLSVATATATIFSLPVAPWLAPLSAALGSITEFFGWSASAVTLDQLRAEAHAALRAAAVRVVLVVDDLDRLEPTEILDMTRVVRSTLDLPHIAFVIAYDRRRVADSIRLKLGVDGEAYLEKIVQLPVDVPHCSTYDLAQSFAERLGAILHDIDQDQTERLSLFVWRDLRQLFIDTPRDVGRILNATSFSWTRLKGEADPADNVVVSTLRVKAPNVFEWALAYCATYFSERAQLFSAEALSARYRESLQKACDADQLQIDEVLQFLSNVLPGLSAGLPTGKPTLFEGRNLHADQTAARSKRLASAQHWRGYFDLSPGRSGITESQFAAFVAKAASDPDSAASELTDLATKRLSVGDTLAERLIDRIRAEAKGSSLGEDVRVSLFDVVAEAADGVVAATGPSAFFAPPMPQVLIWTAASLLKPVDDRLDVVLTAAHRGKAICWLSNLVRYEMMSHGRMGSERSDEDKLLTSDGLDRVCAVAVARIESLAKQNALLDVSKLIYPLLLWRDVAGQDTVRAWVADATRSVDGILKFLHGLKGYVNSTAGNYWRVDRDLASGFADVDVLLAALTRAQESADRETKHKITEGIDLLTRDR